MSRQELKEDNAEAVQVKDSLFKNPAVGALLYNAGNIGTSFDFGEDHGTKLTVSCGSKEQEQSEAVQGYL
jgi:hypothetical protein